jgi:hypothetical protein
MIIFLLRQVTCPVERAMYRHPNRASATLPPIRQVRQRALTTFKNGPFGFGERSLRYLKFFEIMQQSHPPQIHNQNKFIDQVVRKLPRALQLFFF